MRTSKARKKARISALKTIKSMQPVKVHTPMIKERINVYGLTPATYSLASYVQHLKP
jgi:hypothetical protein